MTAVELDISLKPPDSEVSGWLPVHALISLATQDGGPRILFSLSLGHAQKTRALESRDCLDFLQVARSLLIDWTWRELSLARAPRSLEL